VSNETVAAIEDLKARYKAGEQTGDAEMRSMNSIRNRPELGHPQMEGEGEERRERGGVKN